jgi:hypothetical protein
MTQIAADKDDRKLAGTSAAIRVIRGHFRSSMLLLSISAVHDFAALDLERPHDAVALRDTLGRALRYDEISLT